MRNIYKILFLLIAVFMYGCSDIYENDTEEEKEQTVRLLLSFDKRMPQFKSINNVLNESEEKKINSLQVLIFRNSGEERLVKNYYFDKWNGREIIEAFTGRFRYVFIANYPRISPVENYSEISSMIYNINSEEDLVRGKSLVAVFDKKLLVPYPATPGGVVELKDGTDYIQLKRLVAKIQFSLIIDDEILNNGLGRLRERLRIQSIELRTVSTGMYMFRPDVPVDQQTTESINYPVRTIEPSADRSEPIYENYYIPERIANTDMEEGTYAEIKAEYSDIENNSPTKIITYRVRINTKPVENNQYTGLFNVVRNNEYQMNIHIKGVNPDDIRVDIEDIHDGFVFVDSQAQGRKTGGSWEDAFPTITEALHFAQIYNAKPTNSNKIKYVYVKEGTYREKIGMLNNVSVVGGYPAYLKNKELTQDCTVKPVLDGTGIAAPLVSFQPDLTSPTMLAYFEIKNAQNDLSDGGAVYMNSENAVLQGCFIHNNRAINGGGVFILNGQILSSVFTTNKAGKNGAAVYASQPGNIVRIKNSTFVNNEAGSDEVNSSQNSSVIYAGNHSDCELTNSIIVNENLADCTPSGCTYRNCAFIKEDLMSWEEICNGNIRICSVNAPHIYPYAKKIVSAGFKNGSEVYELSNNSDLIGRGYISEGDLIPDFNGRYAFDSFFPDPGACQSGVKSDYMDLYIKNPVFYPFKDDLIDCVLFVNTKSVQFNSSSMLIASQSPEIFKNVTVKVAIPNDSKTDLQRSATIISKKTISFDIKQAYMNFQLNPLVDLTNKFNIVIGPDASNRLSEFLWGNELFFQLSSSVPESDRKLSASSFVNWVGISADGKNISLSNQALKRKVTQPERRYASLNNIKLYYSFNKGAEQVTGLIKPIAQNAYITQIPEWELCQNPMFNVLGTEESDNSLLTGNSSFSTWLMGAVIPKENSLINGKKNTLEAINALLSGGNIAGSDQSDLMHNAFLFCASLNKKTKSKILNAQTLTIDDIEWYLPAIDQLKLMCMFDNNALGFDFTNYYISSTFTNNSLIRFDSQNYQYWSAVPEIFSRESYVRCVRDTQKNLTDDEILSSVKIQDSGGSYVINSGSFYSSQIVRNAPIIPEEGELAEKFEISSVQLNEKVAAKDAGLICSKLEPENTWRLPTQREMALMCLYQERFSKVTFTPFIRDEYVFRGQVGSGVPVQDFNTGAVNVYHGTVNGYVRCVRSVQ